MRGSHVTQTTYLKIGIAGAEATGRTRPPVNLAIVLDRSGSMSGDKLDRAKEAARMAIARLGSQDIVSVIAYDDQVRVLVPATRLSDREAVDAAIAALEPGGSTALFAGVVKGAAEVRKFLDRARVNRVILLSDGLANVGPDSPGELGELGASLAKEGIAVSTIGLGLGYNEDLMTRLAGRSDGNHAFVQEPEDLARIFSLELGDVLSVVAQEVVVTIRCPLGVRPIRVLGRPAEIVGSTVTLELNQLYAEHEKYVLLEVEVAPAATGTERSLAEVGVSYANLLTSARDRLSAKAVARFSDRPEVVAASENRAVMVAVVEQVGTEQSELALALRDQGKVDEARQLLAKNAAFIATNAVSLDSDKLQQQAEANQKDAEELTAEEWNETRKRMREEQSKTQTQRRW